MKKEKQNSYDLDLINLDETAGWDILEVEEQLEYFDEEDGWGKLKSGAGWIKLEYTSKV